MKKHLPKIHLARETVRSLNDLVRDEQLKAVTGGFQTPTRYDSRRPCYSVDYFC